MKRYKPGIIMTDTEYARRLLKHGNRDFPKEEITLVENSEGEWVKYEDAEPFVAFVKALAKRDGYNENIFIRQLSNMAKKLLREGGE